MIDSAIDFMSKNTDQVIDPVDIARTINLSPFHFLPFLKRKQDLHL
jgi:hypothetical protein